MVRQYTDGVQDVLPMPFSSCIHTYREISPGVRLGIAQLRAALASRDGNEAARNLREREGFNARNLQVYLLHPKTSSVD